MRGDLANARPCVSIVRTAATPAPEEVRAAVRKAVDMVCDLRDLVRPGNLVLIKPNLVAVPASRNSGATTSPEVCRALADMVAELGAKPVIAESSAAGVDTEKVIAATGYDKLRNAGYEVVDLKKTPRVAIAVPGGSVLETVEVFELVSRADVIISVPVMKTHDQTEATLSLKNLKGLIPDDEKKRFHAIGVFEGVVDLVGALRPKLAVIDGIVGQEGLGPIFGQPVEMNLIVASRDLVAADTVGGLVMGFLPVELRLCQVAAARGLGVADPGRIQVVGAPVEFVQRRFKRASESVVVDVPDFRVVFKEGTCTGCHNTVFSSIFDMKNDDCLHHLRGKRILAGLLDEHEIPRDVPRENLILVGKCLAKFRDRGVWVKGCPPNNVWVVQAVVGGDARRRYATDGSRD